MTSNGSTAPQPSALRKMPIWMSQISRGSPSPSPFTPPRLEAPATGESRGGLEDRPADLGPVVREVVLAQRAADADRPLRDHSSERGVRAVDLLDGAEMNGDRVLDPR